MNIEELQKLVLKCPNNEELGKTIRKMYYNMARAIEINDNQLNMFDGSKQINS